SEILQTIGIIGNGSFGTAIAKILTDNGHHVKWWLRNESAVEHLVNRHHNPHYLTSVSFRPESIQPTTNLQHVISSCDTIVFALPSAYATGILAQISSEQWRGLTVISPIKGILPDSHPLLSAYLET